MAVDRGGLHYRIEVEDRFSAALARFRASVRAARHEWRGLRQTFQGLGPLTREVSRGLREAGVAAESTARRLRNLRGLQRQSIRDEIRDNARLIRVRRAANAEALRIARARQIESSAQQRAARAAGDTGRLLEAQIRRLRAERIEVSKNTAAYERLHRAKLRASQVRLTPLSPRSQTTLQEAELRLRQQELALRRSALALRVRESRLRQEITPRQIAIRERELALRERGRVSQARLVRSTQRLSRATGRATREQTLFQRALGLTEGRANRISFTFRRLFGILAAFAAARAVLRLFRELVSETIRFNAAIEQATLGVASLITAVGDVRDPFGEAVDSSRELALAQTEARRQVNLLRGDALQTAATFEQLLETFQVALAPGLAAGLDIDQVRRFTIQISQAATAIGVAQNQLAEEIRSLLAGTIQLRTTRIAAALGITNEDIRIAKEAGRLFEFLQDRFQAFTRAGEEALGTFNALSTNLVAAFQGLLESGGLEFFNEIKDILRDLFDLVTSRDPITDALVPEPGAVRVVQALFDSLRDSLRAIRAFAGTLDINELVKGAETVGSLLTTAGQIVAGIVVGFVEGANDLRIILKAIAAEIAQFLGIEIFDSENIFRSVRLLVRAAVILIGLEIVGGAIFGLAKGILSTLHLIVPVITLVRGAILGINAVLTTTVTLTGILVGLFAAIAAAVIVLTTVFTVGFLNKIAEVVEKITGIETSILDVITGLVKNIPTFFDLLGRQITTFVQLVIGTIKFRFAQLKGVITDIFLGAFQEVLRQAAKVFALLGSTPFTKPLADLADELNNAATALDFTAEALKKTTETNLVKFIEEMNKAQGALEVEIFNFLTKLLDDIKNIAQGEGAEGNFAEQLGAEIGKILKSAGEGLTEQFDDFFEKMRTQIGSLEGEDLLGPAEDDLVDIVQAIRSIPPAIQTASNALKSFGEGVRKLEEDFQKVKRAATFDIEVVGLEDEVAQLRRELFEAEEERLEQSKAITKEIQAENTKLNGIVTQRLDNERRVLRLGREQQETIRRGVEFAKDLRDIDEEIAVLKNKIAINENELGRATRLNLRERQAALEAEKIAAEEQLAILEKRKEGIEADNRINIETAGADTETQRELVQLIEERIRLVGQEVLARERIEDLDQAIVTLQDQINLKTLARVNALLRVAAAERSIQNLLEAQEIAREAAFRQVAAAPLEVGRFERLEAELRIQEDFLRTRNDLNQRNFEIQERALDKEIENTRAIRDSAQARLDVAQDTTEIARLNETIRLSNEAIAAQELDLATLVEQRLLARQREAQELDLIEGQLIKLKEIAESPITTAILDGLRAAARDAPTIFEGLFETIRDGVEELSSTIADALADAFDPTKDVDIRNRFANFLLDLARQIFNFLAQIAARAAILGIFQLLGIPSTPVSGIIGPPPGFGGGFAKGGEVPSRPTQALLPRRRSRWRPQGFAGGGAIPRSGVPTPAHRTAKGFASGGPSTFPRPRGISSRDTVPIFASPGEWVIRASTAARYGAAVMRAINEGVFDPRLLRLILAQARTSPRAANVIRQLGGAQTGGAIPRASETSQQRSEPTLAFAFIAPDEEGVERLTKGGRSALIQFLRTEKNAFLADERIRR